MHIGSEDLRSLRELAGRYSEIAHLEVQQQRTERYYRSNALEPVRPLVLIDEVPWGEIRDPALVNTCASDLAWLEGHLRRTLYQWEHFQVDLVVEPVFHVSKRIRWLDGIGIEVRDRQLKGDTGAYISSHAYADELKDDDDLARLHEERLEYDREASEQALAVARQVFDGFMQVDLVAPGGFGYSIWDRITTLRGVDNLLMDLAMRPEFMHRVARRFTDIAKAHLRQRLEQGLLGTRPLLLHCTPASTRELPAPDFDGRVRPRDIWGRCAAQVFGSVSPAMHDEFDLAYNQEIFGECGLLYYGCCEPLDRKIDLLRQRFANLRKVSITPWADPRRAAEAIGGDYVVAAKPNPAFVAMPAFDPKPVVAEISRYCEACQQHGCTLEFVLKDISTIANNPANLTHWSRTVASVLDRYYD